MSNIKVSKNIYSKNGVLLLAAGQVVTKEIFKRLESMDYIETDDIFQIEDEKSSKTSYFSNNNATKHVKNSISNDVRRSADKIQLALKFKNIQIFDSATEIVEKIVFESRNQPWASHINALSNYVNWIYTHSIDVSLLSVMIAQMLKLDDRLEDIALGAFFHDIGKLLVPKNTLLKPSKLTNEEMFYVRQHCDIGVSILKNYNFNQITLDIVQHHHERLDGSGYPHGLSGELIPLHVRISMVADAINAMTSFRPYRPMKDIDTALKELREESNRYPQDIIDLMCQLM